MALNARFSALNSPPDAVNRNFIYACCVVELTELGARSLPGNNQGGGSNREGSPAEGSARNLVNKDDPDKSKDDASEHSLNESELDRRAVKAFAHKQEIERQTWGHVRGIFWVHDKPDPIYLSRTSLWCLDDQNFLRKALVWIIEWKWFDRIITLAILLNSALLASTDYEKRFDPTYESEWEPTQEKIDRVFTWIFIVECMFKVLAMGFVLHSKSYLRDAWNCLDFFIVCVSVVDLLGVDSDALKSLRTFRILRPLRSINAMPTMRALIQSLLGAIPGLLNTIVFLGFIFSIFAIFGTNQFLGKTNYFCRVGDPTYDEITGEFLIWQKAEADWLCMTDDDCLRMTGDETSRCGSVYDEAGVDPIKYDDVRNNELIMYGIPNFDNIGHSLVSIFQVLSLESWVYMMYNYSDSSGGTISVIFFILVVVLGAFFTMNLVLAQIMDAFEQQQQAKDEKAAEMQQQAEDEANYEKE